MLAAWPYGFAESVLLLFSCGFKPRTSETTGDQIEAAKAARARQDEADREAGLKAAAAKAPQMKVATDSGKRQLSSNPDAVPGAQKA